MPLRVRRYDVPEAGRETLDKSPCPSFTVAKHRTSGHQKVPRTYFLDRVERVVRCEYKEECCVTSCGKVLFGASYTLEELLFVFFYAPH